MCSGSRQSTGCRRYFASAFAGYLFLDFCGLHDSGAFADGEYLVALHLRKAFNFLRGRPFDLDEICDLGLAQSEVEAQIALRHDACAAVDLIHLSVFAGDHANASPDCGAIAFRANQLDLDPILPVAAVVAKQ